MKLIEIGARVICMYPPDNTTSPCLAESGTLVSYDGLDRNDTDCYTIEWDKKNIGRVWTRWRIRRLHLSHARDQQFVYGQARCVNFHYELTEREHESL